ncbi:MAG TPA: tRNA (adenosine(37)-N6)-threonylcarbamoyltransferase complex ATPase subunit type 1 TsaE [Mycobacteriales bacterium]|nr:tRNA (adenosine(37)-N6)-threonylcarbamoyltransferase complex ATPase subunit type 1 TsaE [Mycobacteriales bacterium]
MTPSQRVETPEAMRALGERIAERLRAGDLAVLSGPLGAGKTTLAQGIGRGLGVTGPVLSPTFVIARVHRGGRLPLVHADAYRLGSVAEVDDLDLDASLDESVTLVEWGEGLVEGLAGDRLEITISREGDGDTRLVEVVGVGRRWGAGASGSCVDSDASPSATVLTSPPEPEAPA